MTTSGSRTVILAGGEMHTSPSVSDADLVIAADSGYDHAMAHSIPVDILVGDLDSISSTGLQHARDTSVSIDKHPQDKNQTDLELAIRKAIDRESTTIDIYGGEGGRLGHLLGVALSTAHPGRAPVDIAWHTATGIVRTADPNHSVAFPVMIGQLVTLLPVGDARGVTTTGLKWPLDKATLERGTSRGVSNESVSDHVTVEVGRGSVLVVLEGAEST
ncbi:MAG: thiamine diphosphokinase [Acidimicrobiia bacterium]